MKKKILYAAALSMGILGCSVPAFATEEINELEMQEKVQERISEKPETPETISVGWHQDEKGWTYVGEDGAMKYGWEKINGVYYNFGEDGVMLTGWQFLGGDWYYLGEENDGAMKCGWEKINGVYYNFGEDGAMLTGWQSLGGHWYYLGAENDGSMEVGWAHIDGHWYYFGAENDGTMHYGWEKINGVYYNFGEDGVMLTGWQFLGGDWYYLGKENDGAMKCGWEQVDGVYYNFGEDGVMRTGLQIINDDVYMLKDNGAMAANENYNFNGGKLPIGEDGRVEKQTANVIKKAYHQLNQVGWNLRKAFDWSAEMEYYRMQNYGIGPEKGDVHSVWYGNYGFDNEKGNCYVMASTFCYMARLLGYETYYVEGQVPLASGGMGPHGWCEIVMDGTTYVFDPDFTNNTGRNGFQIYYGMSGTWRYSNYKRVE